jgi:hypothetical protein
MDTFTSTFFNIKNQNLFKNAINYTKQNHVSSETSKKTTYAETRKSAQLSETESISRVLVTGKHKPK